MKFSPLLFLALACLVPVEKSLSQATPASNVDVPVLPVDQWQTSSGKHGDLSLSAKEGCLVLNYKVNVDSLHQVGFENFHMGTARLLFKQPLALDPGFDRIQFEAVGSQWNDWTHQGNQIRLRPLIRDASGEILTYSAFPDDPIPVEKSRPAATQDALRWRRWMTRQFYTSEAGGATQDIFEASGGNGSAWPEAPLTFLGFEIEVRKPQFGPVEGTLVLGGCRLLGGPRPFEDPWIFADFLLKSKGHFQVGYEATNQFQGRPVRSGKTELDFDPASLAGTRQRIPFPLGPDDNYWINYRVVGDGGSVIASNFLRYQIYDRPNPSILSEIDPKTPPALGLLRINPNSHPQGVYDSGESLRVTARVFADPHAGSRQLQWQLTPYAYPEILESGTQDIPRSASKFSDVAIRLKGTDGRDAWRLEVRLVEDGKTVDQADYLLGRRTTFGTPAGKVTSLLCDRDYIKKSSYNRVTLQAMSDVKFQSEDGAIGYYCERLDQIARITPNVCFSLDPRDLQPLPGVYDFHFLDRLLEAAAKRGMAMTFRVQHVDENGPFTWVKYSRQHNYDGGEIPEHFYGGFSVVDKVYAQVWHDTYFALYRRYADNPAFQGYYLMQPAGEFTVSDKPWEGIVSGYEPPMREAFREYLQKNLHLDLTALNMRWGSSFKTWDEVLPPLPDFRIGKKPDLRMNWVDFCCFKRWLDDEGWFPAESARIRSYDPHHVIIVYGDPRRVEGVADYGHNGGNHFLRDLGKYVEAWEKYGTGWITEPHQPQRWAAYGDPAERGWVLDWSVWVMTAQAGAGGANFHLYYEAKPSGLIAHYGDLFGYDRMQKFYPVLQELHEMKLCSPPPQVAVLQDPYTLFCKHRTTFSPRGEDLCRWFELLTSDNIPYESFDPAHVAQYKLILPNLIDEVMSRANIEAVVSAVRDGGARIILSANTGRYCPELGTESFPLLTRLGISAPKGDYVTGTGGIKAQILGKNPLFADGATSVPFFTLADLQHDLQSPEVRDKFWSYPYRWIPQTDYFGVYPDNQSVDGDIIARFPSGAPAISRHRAGKGEAIVFWGTPDYRPSSLGGFMRRAAAWAGVDPGLSDNPLPLMIEGKNMDLRRHYALIYNEKPGAYTQRLEFLGDGDWFVDDMVSGDRLGTFSGAAARRDGIPLSFSSEASPLKILRFIPREKMQALWLDKYPEPVPQASVAP